MDDPLPRRPVKGASQVVVIENADIGNADGLPQSLLVLKQGCFHPLPPGNVQHRAVHAARLAGIAVVELASGEDPMLTSVRPDDAKLLTKGATGIARRVQGTIQFGQIVRMETSFKGGICPIETSRLEAEHPFVMPVPDDLTALRIPIERTQRRGVDGRFQAVFTGGERSLRLAPAPLAIEMLQAKCHVERHFPEQVNLSGTERAGFAGVDGE